MKISADFKRNMAAWLAFVLPLGWMVHGQAVADSVAARVTVEVGDRRVSITVVPEKESAFRVDLSPGAMPVACGLGDTGGQPHRAHRRYHLEQCRQRRIAVQQKCQPAQYDQQ